MTARETLIRTAARSASVALSGAHLRLHRTALRCHRLAAALWRRSEGLHV